ncbi:autotransporter outer membrane beta-barrel domain-containing protein [Cyanobium gracile]|uniref:autotransporter family protein n=1 Tax=Cyanobium gracile TaxID=59930 RepID=UPI001FE23699|nr:autotransporter outer membrane beta-barrel domain-containing protein [Cyanobium gracile]
MVDASGPYATDYTLGEAGGTVDTNGNIASFNGVFSGSGPFGFTNTGVGGGINLSADNPYRGFTTINNGAVVLINGSIASSAGLLVQSGGTVGGNGFLPFTTINPGGSIAPGNSIGTLTAAALNLNGGTIRAEIQGPQVDRINVTGAVGTFSGTATLTGFGGGGPWPGLSYTIVAAPNSPDFATPGSLMLQPVSVPSALLNLGTTLIQEADGNPRTFDVRWQPRNGQGATTSALQLLGQGGVNQLATAGAFDRVFQSLAIGAGGNANNTGAPIGTTGFTTDQAAASGVSADFLGATAALLGLTSGSQLSAAIDSLSPEPYAAFQSVGLETLKRQRKLLMAQAGSCRATGWVVRAEALASGKRSPSPWCVFALAANGSSTIDGGGGLSGYRSGVFSSFIGVEVRPGPGWTVGLAYGRGTSSLNNMALTNASVTAGVNSMSFYGVYQPTDRWNVRGLVGYANFKGNGSRLVAFIGNGSAIDAATNANGYNVAINADYRIDLTGPTARTPVTVKPLLGLAWGGYQQLSFGELDGGPLNLQVQGHTANSLVGTVGLELATGPIPLNRSNTTAITPRLAVAYQVDALGNDAASRSITSSFSSAPAAGTFITQGQNRGVNAFVVDGGVDLKVAENASVYAGIGYEVFSNGSQFTYSGGVKVKF